MELELNFASNLSTSSNYFDIMLKNSMSTLVLPNFHSTSENCINFRDSLNVESNLPNLPPVSNWNYEDTTTYISNLNLQNSIPNVIDNHMISHYQTTQNLLNSSKQSLPSSLFLPSYADSGCLSLNDETSMINVNHSTSTPVHTVDNDSTTPTSNISTTTISPINIDSLDNMMNETQIIVVSPNNIQTNPMIMKDYCKITTTVNTSTITMNTNTTCTNPNNDQLVEQKQLRIVNYSEENQTPLMKQSMEEYKRNCNMLNISSNMIKNKQHDEMNQDESHSDSELNLSTESISRKNRAEVKIQPYALRGNIEVFRCPLCSKDEIFSRGHLTNHLQDHQSNFKREDYKHVCCFCFSELSSNSSLERHLLTHTNHRPFNCNLCDKAFTTNGNLSRHVRTSHQAKATTINNLTSFTSTTTSSLSQTIQSITKQSTYLPNWFQSSNSLHTSPISNTYTKLKSSSIQHTTKMNDYQNRSNIQKSPIKSSDLNNHGINSLKILNFHSGNDLCISKMNLIQSTSNSDNNNNDNKQSNVNTKSCVTNLQNVSSYLNKTLQIEPIKFTSINSEECQTDYLPNLPPNYSNNLTDWSTSYMKHEQQNGEEHFNKFTEIESWPSYKPNTTSSLLQMFTNYWLQLSKNCILNNSTHTSLDARTVIASLLPSVLLKNSTINSTFESNDTLSSVKNNEYDINENFSHSESPRITIREIPPLITNEIEENMDYKFYKTYNFNPTDYVISSSPNTSLENNQYPRKPSKYINKTNRNISRKSRITKLCTTKTFSVRYILAKKKKSLSVIGKRKRTRKVTEMKFQPLSPLQCDFEQNKSYNLKQNELTENQFSPYRSQSLQNQYTLSSTDYVCSPNNLSNTSSRRSPIKCSYHDNYLTDITELNHTQSLESNSDEVLDLSLHNRKQDILEGSYTLSHEVHTLGRSNIPWMEKPDISLQPPVFTPINTSDTLCSSYRTTNILAQSEADIKLSNQEFNLNNILHDIYSLPIMQHMKTLPTPINNEFKRDTTTGTTISNSNPLNILPLPANPSNINKMFPVHSTIPTTLIQKKNSYKDAPKLITCPIAGCQQKFPWNSSLKRHILTHTPHKPFACTRCTKSFSTKSNRERHMERVHRVSLKRQRQRFHQSNMSIQSPSSGDNRSELSGHNSNLNSISRTNIGDNDQELDNIEELREDEIISMNSNEKQAEDISNSLLIRAGDPVVEPNPERLYNAALLAVANSTRSGLTNYLNDTSSNCIKDIPQSMLPTVPVRFGRTGRVGRRPRRGNILNTRSNVLDKDDQITFHTIPQTSNANSSMHDDVAEPPVDLSMHSTSKNASSTLSCPVCSVPVASRCFRRHLTLHQLDNPVFRCHLCQLTFQDQVSTLTHWAMEHSNEWAKFVKKLSSNERSADVLTQIQLTLSKNNQTKAELEKDNETNKNLPESKDPINYSLKATTYDMRYVSCCVCLHRFGSQQDLQRHMRSHTGERPFVCPHCGKEFSLKHSMHRHARVHIKESVRINASKNASLSTNNHSCPTFKSEEIS
ncbi:unnamed protein product [Schistosoma mattheei]|uniref:C2H2-type domain-containing protein n=1 Tax=Schistosoma mattheei TaxID=31246 RepID=A0A3P8DAF1_9TREM|nr:unnamed protein product [Schistosoma mattheei]